jgi:molybdopterin/thiamine biosynthesis adenylyltransferase
VKEVVIIGVGALGSHVLLFARNLPVSLKIVDFDRVEMKNTKAQVHTLMGVGRNKVQALQQAFQGMWGMKLAGVPHKLTDDNVDQVLNGAALVVDCTDNAAARRVIQTFVRKAGVPCLHGALSNDGTFARIVWDEYFTADAETPGQATCEDGQALPFFGLAGAEMAVIIQQFLTAGKKISVQMTPTGIVRLA